MMCFHGHGPAHLIVDILTILPFVGFIILSIKIWFQKNTSEHGTLAYAKSMQAEIGGYIRCDDGWYWVSLRKDKSIDKT